MVLQVQFEAGDVTRAMNAYMRQQGANLEDFLKAIEHDLGGPLFKLLHVGNDFAHGTPNKHGQFPNLHARAYVDNIGTKAALLYVSLKPFLGVLRRRQAGQHPDSSFVEGVGDLVSTLLQMCVYVPITPQVEALGEISPERASLLRQAELWTSLVVYTANSFFSRRSEQDRYFLSGDVMTFAGSFPNTANMYFDSPYVQPIVSQADYFTHAVLPLIQNVLQHALNPENNIYGRPESCFFAVGTKDDPAKKELTFSIADKGYGIRPEILPHIFDRGVTTKPDRETEHGIGLWSVKRFVEEHGGSIQATTELGKGTFIQFTIPYSRKEGHFCVQ